MSTTASARARVSTGVSTRSFSTMRPSASTTPPAILVPPMSIPTLSTALPLPARQARRGGDGALQSSARVRRHPGDPSAAVGADRTDGRRTCSDTLEPDLPENPTGTEGVAVVQFEVPAIVPADPQANVTDLLVDRVKATPQLALFAVPDGDGWRDITATEFHTSGHRPGQGLRRRRHRARRQGRLHRPHDIRLDARRFRAVLRRRRHGADLRDQLARADRVEPDRLGRDRLHHRVGRPLRAARRGPRRGAARALGLGDAPRRPRQARRAGQGRRRTTRSSAAATSPTAPTSRRSSTRPARPAGRRAACSRTATSSS